MSETNSKVLIGDANPNRVRLLREILKDQFNQDIILGGNYDELKAEVKNAKTMHESGVLVLVASDLPESKSNPTPIVPSLVNQFGIEVKIGCIYSSEKRPLWENGNVRFYLRVPVHSPTPADLDRIRDFLDDSAGLLLVTAAPKVDLANDPSLREQVRTLNDDRDLEKGKKLLGYFIRDFNLGDNTSAKVEKLVQGKSGARVFRINVKTSQGKSEDYVLKLSPTSDRWKLDLEIKQHELAQGSLNLSNYKKHVADMRKARNGQSIVQCHNWLAVCYDFLGGYGFGKVLDLEAAVITTPEALRVKTEGISDFDFDPSNASATAKARKRVLEIKLKWLCKALYEKPVGRKICSIWWAEDRDATSYPSMPPYQLTGKSKGYILSFLDSYEAAIGSRLFDSEDAVVESYYFKNWQDRLDKVRDFIEQPQANDETGEFFSRRLPVLLSRVHGDLNASNILLWLDDKRTFLIDFPCYQEAGHALQDLASLEVAIKFLLLDRQGGSPKEKLRAFDHTHSQVEIWREMEDHLLSAAVPDDKQWLQAHCFSDNVTFCFELVRMVRERAVQVQKQMPDPHRQPEFMEEYLPALLYYTVRAIGYDSLSLFKRLLAVYSTSEILVRLEQPSVVAVHS